MSRSLRRIGEYLGLTSEESAPVAVESEPSEVLRRGAVDSRSVGTVRRIDEPEARVVQLPRTSSEPSVRAVPAQEPPSRIITVSPHNFNDASHVGEEIRRGHAVIMNLNDCDEALARRLVDYASGLVHGIDGKIAKVSRGIFVISPNNVNVDELVNLRSEESTFFNQS